MPDSNDTNTVDSQAGSAPESNDKTQISPSRSQPLEAEQTPNVTTDFGTHPQAPDGFLLTSPISPGTRERYTVTRLHATGGLGRVWLAHDAGMNREVALKELLPERSALPSAAARFLREARITGQLEHPGIVPVYELAQDPHSQSPFYTMRFVRGRTLGEAIGQYHQRRTSGTATPMDLRELLNAFNMLCQAVAYAHSRRVIHRDLKPANVILGDFGEVILLDWGIAKVLGEPEQPPDPDRTVDHQSRLREADDAVASTQYGQVLGTPSYMAPEQAGGEKDRINERTDVYGLGAILFEIATGTVPFHGANVTELLNKVKHTPAPRLTTLVRDVPKPLEAIVLTCLNKNPNERYDSAKAIAADVSHFLADEPVSVYRDPLRVRFSRWARRHRTLVTALSVVMLVAIPTLAVSLILVSNAANRERDARVAAVNARDEAEANFQKAVRSAEVVSEELARGIRPIAGTQSKTVVEILTRAEAVYDDLLASPNPPPRVRLNKVKMLILVADVYRGMARLRSSIERADQAISMAKELVVESPGTREYQIALASAYHKRAWAYWDSALATKSLADFNEAIRLFDAVGVTVEADPDDTYTFASCLTISGNILTEFGDANTARANYKRGLQMREALYKRFPQNPQMAMQLAISLERFGLFNLRMDEKEAGYAQLEKAVLLNEAAHATDRGNSEFAKSLIRSLNSYGLQIISEDRPKAMTYLVRAKVLAETFAKRDPDDNLWVREDLRARWLAAELDKVNWIRLTPEERRAARAELVRLINLIIGIAQKRIAENPENGMWHADLANMQGRLAAQLHESANAGDDPETNRALALGLANDSYAGYLRGIEMDSGSYENKLGALYALWIKREILVAKKPDSEALLAHWKYVKFSLETWGEMYRKWPAHFEGVSYFRTSMFVRVLPTGPLRDTWLAHSGEVRVVEAMLDVAVALPTPEMIREDDLRNRTVILRKEMLTRLTAIGEKIPLPERAQKIMDSLK